MKNDKIFKKFIQAFYILLGLLKIEFLPLNSNL